MNKGLSAHIIVTIVYALCIQYIFDGYGISKRERVIIVVICLCFNFLTTIVSFENDWYKEKIN